MQNVLKIPQNKRQKILNISIICCFASLWIFLIFEQIQQSIIVMFLIIVALILKNKKFISTYVSTFKKQLIVKSQINTKKFYQFLRNFSKELQTEINQTKEKTSEIKNPIKQKKIYQILNPILSTKIITKIENSIQSSASNEILKSGQPENLRALSKKAVTATIIGLFLTIPISIILGTKVNTVLFGIIIIPLMFLISNKLKHKSKISERKSLIEYELPFFGMYLSIMQTISIPTYEAIKSIIDSNIDIFNYVKNECYLIRKNVEFHGKDFTKAIQLVIKHHPNQNFVDFMNSYLFSLNSGGNPIQEIQNMVNLRLEDLKVKMKGYVEKANNYTVLMTITLGVLPLMVIPLGFVATEGVATKLSIFSLFIIPAMALMIFLQIESSQIRLKNNVKISKFTFPAICVSLIISIILQLESWFVLGIAVCVGSGINMFKTQPQFREIKKLEDGIPVILRAIAQDQLSPTDYLETFRKISQMKINKPTDDFITYLTAMLNRGKTLHYAIEKYTIRSWLVRFPLFIIAKLQETGAHNPHIVYNLAKFIEEFHAEKKRMTAQMSSSIYYAYLGPISLIFIILMMQYMAADSTNIIDQSGVDASLKMLNIDTNLMNINPQLIEIMYLLTVVSAISSGIVISKIVFASLKNTVHVFGITLSTIVLLNLIPTILDIVSQKGVFNVS